MPRTVVIDLGGVLLRWDPPALISSAWPDLAPDRFAADALVRQVFQGSAPGGDWADFDRGLLGPSALVARMSARTGLPATRVQALLDAIPAHLAVQPATGRLLDRMRGAGLRLVYLSNMPAPFADRLDLLPDFRGWFDDGVFSARVGHVKPEPEIFALAEQRLGLDPGRTLLLDDRPENVAAAVDRGWAGQAFVAAEDAEVALTALGWLPGSSVRPPG
jgi:putative hydrolase of the HAD superfamily